jgi:pimeloyl-ACP methyl ester carboxylesterase
MLIRRAALLFVSLAVTASLFANVVADAPSRWAKGPSGKIHYKSWGKGSEALIFVHGWSCDMTYFAEQVPHFAQSMRVIALDLPGHGKSDAPEIDYTQTLFADSIRIVMDAAKVKRAVLVGHSMGMPVVRQFSRLYPKRTAGIVGLDGSVKAMITDPKAIEGFLANLRGPAYKESATRMIDGMLAAAPDSPYKQEIRTTMLATPQHVVAGAAAGMFDLKFWNDDPIKVPTLLIYAPSPMWSKEYEQYARRLIPDLEYVVIPGVSHFLHTEKPVEVNAHIDAFLANHGLLGQKTN